MQEEPNDRKTAHRITSVFTIGAETLASVAPTQQLPLEAGPIALGELPSALKKNRAEIIVKRPKRLPSFLFLLVVFVLIWLYTSDRAMVTKGLHMKYNVQRCTKLEIAGVVWADCVRLTRPTDKGP